MTHTQEKYFRNGKPHKKCSIYKAAVVQCLVLINIV